MESVIPPQNRGYRFDIATSLNGDGYTINSSMFVDNQHPNVSGCMAMAERYMDFNFF